MKERIGPRYLLPGAACLAVFTALSAAFLFLPSQLGVERVWRGAFTLLVDKSADIRQVSSQLEAAGFDGLISAATARVSYSVFDDAESVSVADIPERFAAGDSRLDPWLKGIGAFFTSADERYHVLYLPVGAAWLSAAGALSAALDRLGVAWTLPERHPPRQLFFQAVFAGLAAFITVRFRRGRALAALAALPWLNCVSQGSLAYFTAAVLGYLGLAFFLEEADSAFRHLLQYRNFDFQRAETVNRLAFLCLSLAAGLALIQYPDFEPRRLAPLLLSWAASAGLLGARCFFLLQGGAGREHRLFLPVSLLSSRGFRGWARDYGFEFRLVAALLILVPLALALVAGAERVGVAKPVAAPGVSGRGPGALEQLWIVHRRDRLPDLSDYLAHRAYQDGMAYGRPYAFPKLNEKLQLAGFSQKAGSIKKEEKMILCFDETWFKKAFEADSMTGIERLLAAETSACEVVYGKAGKQPLDWGYLVVHAVAAALLFAPFILGPISFNGRRMQVTESLFAGRKQQEA